MAFGSKMRQHGRTTELLFTALELKLVSTVGTNKKDFKKLINSRRQTRNCSAP